MNGKISEIKKLLGISSIDKKIYSTFFPKSKIKQSQFLIQKKGTSEQIRVSNQISDTIKDCKFIKKRLEFLKTIDQTEDTIRDFDLNSFIFERKVEELVFLVEGNFPLFYDYFDDNSIKKTVERIFIENDLHEGVEISKELELFLFPKK